MVICPQCNIEHGEGEEFCRKCGSFLLAVEDLTPEEGKTRVKLICPKCQVLYKKGNYCRKCGSLLMQGIPSQETDLQPLEKKSVKKWSKEWLRLLKEEKELESCMSKLEGQRDSVSSDVLNPIFVLYKDRLESLSPLHQEIETELESIRKRASEEIDFLEKELKPIQKRLEEFQSLYKLGAVTKPDFIREKKELRKEIKSREKFKKLSANPLSLARQDGRKSLFPRIHSESPSALNLAYSKCHHTSDGCWRVLSLAMELSFHYTGFKSNRHFPLDSISSTQSTYCYGRKRSREDKVPL